MNRSGSPVDRISEEGIKMADEQGIGKEILAFLAFFYLLACLHAAWAGTLF
jgi:hypothetical protein